ncbi:MAG: CPBP family intramembrane metalloprotease, partial [Sphaerochaetaceae bacterium]|nr:CPBP family intramembrane metalloprotease [Sphaerochaetaceae bacterium]
VIQDTTLIAFVTLNMNFIVLLVLILLFSKLVLKTSILSFLTSHKKFRWSLMTLSACVWIIVPSLAVIIRYFIDDLSVIAFTPINIKSRLVFIVLALVLTPIQSVAEEMLFRTYLWRMLYRWRYVAPVVSALTFALAHLANREVTSAIQSFPVIAYYLLTGLIFMELTIRSNGSEIAIGAHAGNNLFIALAVNYKGSTMVGYPMFIQEHQSPLYDMGLLLVCSALTLVILSKVNKSDTRPYLGNFP